jgi:hypothetical protein
MASTMNASQPIPLVRIGGVNILILNLVVVCNYSWRLVKLYLMTSASNVSSMCIHTYLLMKATTLHCKEDLYEYAAEPGRPPFGASDTHAAGRMRARKP